MKNKKQLLLLVAVVIVLIGVLSNNAGKPSKQVRTTSKTDVRKESKESPEVSAKKEELSKEVLEYLKAKYQEEFEVDNVRILPYERGYEIKVHPSKKSYINFTVRKLKMTGFNYSDDYIRTQWSEESNKYIQEFVDDISEKNSFNARIRPIESELYLKLRDEDQINFDTLVEKYIEESKLIAQIYCFKDITEENKEDVLKSVYELVKFIKSKKIKTAQLEIFFFDEEYFEDKNLDSLYAEIGGIENFMTFKSKYNNFLYHKLVIFPEVNNNYRLKYVLFDKINSYKELEYALNGWSYISETGVKNPKKPYEK